ncbi:DNA methyltransferase [Priestia megaterium]
MERLSWEAIETKAVAFSKNWKNCNGDERQEAQKFEIDLMNVFGVDFYKGLHEHQVRDSQGKIGYIDYLLPGKILIEMKSKGESLVRAYNQAYDYTKCLKPEEYPELLLVSDFDYIQVTNLKTMQTFKKFKVSQLKSRVRMLGLLAGYNSEVTFKTDIEVNTDASYKMAKLHDTLKENGYEGEDLEVYLVRLLFCLFAEDTGIFEKNTFEQYIKDSKEDGSDLSSRMMLLFSTLDTPENKRMNNLSNELRRFRYINGKLFSKPLPPAYFDRKMRQILIDCCDFDWSYISPAIFGAMFQGVMNQIERRELGAHYTSEENILKLIKPLFLDELWDEFEKSKSTKAELEAFHNKLANLNFLDPACGCGNFLIITYRELRLLEFEVLKMLHDNRQLMIIDTLCKISIEQFYGIEYEEFPCQIAHVGLLLMKHQLDKEVSNYFGMNIIDFPIKETANIVHGNALQINWEDFIKREKLSFIIGNPPFVGAMWMKGEKRDDMLKTFPECEKPGQVDYVVAWFVKAAKLISSNNNIKAAFVATNSIVQGQQVPLIWKPLIETYNIHIDFAYRTFKWSNDAKGKAAVHCVIIGFSSFTNKKEKFIYDGDITYKALNINPYLIDAPTMFISSTRVQVSGMPNMHMGSMARDGGNLILSEEEYLEYIKQEPQGEKFIKKYMMGKELLNNIRRYCFWLVDVKPSELMKCPILLKRIEKVRQYRLESKAKETQKFADRPMLFCQIAQPKKNYIAVPSVSSERRRYIPMDFLTPDVIVGNKIYVVEDATLYNFGILMSNVHNSWMRLVCGRLKSDYNYSNSIVYNNFVWPNPTTEQKERIEQAAQAVLDARLLYSDSSLAEMYGENMYLYTELAKAHKNLDKEVSKAYGSIWKTEEECVTHLMKMHRKILDSKAI